MKREVIEFVFLNNHRLFKIGDRVKMYFKERWWIGTIKYFKPAREEVFKTWWSAFSMQNEFTEVIGEGTLCGLESVIYHDYRHCRMFVRTDEKVDEEKDALFDGYGLRSGLTGKDIIFESEEEYIPEPFLESSHEDLGEDLPEEELPF